MATDETVLELPRSRKRVAATTLLFATLTASLLGWAALILAARVLGPTSYADFAVVWGLFFGLAGMSTGLQQEVTRAVAVSRGSGGVAVWRGALVAALLGTALVLAGAPLWQSALSGPVRSFATAAAIATGLLAISMMTTLYGALTADGEWKTLGVLLVLDPAVRLLVTWWLVADLAGHALGVAIVSGSFAWLLMFPRRAIRAAFSREVGFRLREFVSRSLVAMTGAAMSSLVVTGFPFLVEVLGNGTDRSRLGVFFATLMITRGVILMPIYGLRPLLQAHLLGAATTREVVRSTAKITTLILSVGSLVAASGYVAGSALIRAVYGAAYAASADVVTGLIVGALFTAVMVVTGLALIVVRLHVASTVGWAIALGVTCVFLVGSWGPYSGALWATVVGPLSGLATHSVRLAWAAR